MDTRKIHRKFQLLDNQRNQQKREVCRKCFQTGLRGLDLKLNIFNQIHKEWPKNVPNLVKKLKEVVLDVVGMISRLGENYIRKLKGFKSIL